MLPIACLSAEGHFSPGENTWEKSGIFGNCHSSLGWILSAEHVGSRLDEKTLRVNEEVDCGETTEKLWGIWIIINRLWTAEWHIRVMFYRLIFWEAITQSLLPALICKLIQSTVLKYCSVYIDFKSNLKWVDSDCTLMPDCESLDTYPMYWFQRKLQRNNNKWTQSLTSSLCLQSHA